MAAQPNGNGAINASPGTMQGLNSSQQEAVAGIVANDAVQGATVHTFNPNAPPEEKAKKAGGLKGVFGAPKAIGKGVASGVTGVGRGVGRGVTTVGSGVGRGVSTVGKGVVDVGTGVVSTGANVVGAGAGAVVGGVGAVGGGAVRGVGAVGRGARNAVGSLPGMGAIKNDGSKTEARAVAIDTSTMEDAPAPTVDLEDAKKATEEAKYSVDNLPGGIPKTVLPGIPGWLELGWKQVGGIEGGGTDAKTKEQTGILAQYLSEKYYGQWYHNAGVIVFAVLATRLISAFRLGWGWVLVILAVCSTVYSLSIARTRTRARDDIQRELVKTRLVTETESADWLNSFLDRFWLMYEPVLSQTIVSSVDAALVANTPSFLESIRMTTFTLGNKAPRIDYVRTFPKSADDEVIMDWALSFTPNDLQDVTPRQAAGRVNPKIVLTIRLGKGVVSTGMPILLEDLNFSGKMRIKLKLMPTMPHIQRVEMSFLEKPSFDYVLKPVGGETFGFDINSIPGLEPFIRDQVHANLGPMMYDPNVFTIDLEQLMSGEPLDAANGVVKVTVLDAQGLKATKMGGGAPDPYVALALGGKDPVARTKTVMSSNNPSWHETHFILISALTEVLDLNVFDFNDHRPDTHLGTVSQELASLADDAEQEGIVGKVLGGGKERGSLRYNLSYYPVIQPEKKPDGTFGEVPDSPTGIVRLMVHQAKDFTGRASDMNLQANVYLGGGKTPIHKTEVKKKSNSPSWESHTEFLVADKRASVVTVQVVDAKSGKAMGRVTAKLSDILAAREKGNDWFPLQGGGSAKVRLTASFKPVAMAGAIDSAASYVPPIGVLRVWLKGATDVKNVELGGKSDPYVRVLANNKTIARTEVQDSNLNPVWDQIVYVPVHSLHERVILEVMDYQNIGKDRTLGTVDLMTSDFAAEGGDQKFPYISTGPQSRAERIKVKANQYKGVLNFDVDFKPAASLRGGVEFDAKKNDLEIAAEQKAENGASAPTPTTSGPAGQDGPKAAAPAAPGETPAAVPAVSPENGKTDDAPADGEPTEAEKPEAGVVMSPAELLACQSGVVVFDIIDGQLARKASFEVVMDDGLFPSYASERARSNNARWDQVGEGFVRELDFSQVWLRLNASDDTTEKDEIIAELRMPTKDFLEQALDREMAFTLQQGDGGNRSQVRLSARYIPVAIQLEPRETVNNQGILRVNVISGKGLKAADRGGKSDPNVTFRLNGEKVFKSETIKKTVNPTWNETFQCAIPSRVGGQFVYEVNDWNTVGSAEELGAGAIDLAALEPFSATDLDLPVVLNGKQHGSIQLKLLFTPQFITRQRHKTNTFVAGAGRTLTTVGNAPVAVGKGVVSGVGTVVSAPTRLFRKKDRSASDVSGPPPNAQGGQLPVVDEATAGYAVAQQQQQSRQGQPVMVGAGQVSAPAAPGAAGQSLPTGADQTTLPPGLGASPEEPGILTVAIISAKDIRPQGDSHKAGDLKPYALIKVGPKSFKTDHGKGVEADWNETFNFNISPGTNTFNLSLWDKHTIGKDVQLGEGQVDIWRHIQPAVPTADVFVEMAEGSGQVKLRLDWAAGVATKGSGLTRNRSRTPSVSSKNGDRNKSFSLTPSKN